MDKYVEIGKGFIAFGEGRFTGVVKHFKNPSQVVEVIENPELLQDMIALVKDQGVTLLGPLMAELRGIISTSGTPRSHLGIVSREYQVPCLMGTVLVNDIPDGVEVLLDFLGEEGSPYKEAKIYMKAG